MLFYAIPSHRVQNRTVQKNVLDNTSLRGQNHQYLHLRRLTNRLLPQVPRQQSKRSPHQPKVKGRRMFRRRWEEVHWGPKAKVWKVVHEVLGPHCEGLPGPDELRETSNIRTRD